MFKSDLKKLQVSFNEFHDVKDKDMPEYGDYCLLELKDGRYTAGQWYPKDYKSKKAEGSFGRGTGDSVDVSEVSKWHALERYDLTNCLEDEKVTQINLGPEEEGIHSVKFGDFKLVKAGSLPKEEQFCLLIMKNGRLAAGRWNQYSKKDTGSFIYASALASHSMKETWAWTALSPDDIFEREEESERERLREEELNKNPSADPVKFKYGTDINVYYEKALEKLRKKYPWATLAQMKKKQAYAILPLHGQYVFGQDGGVIWRTRAIREWTEGSTADEFIDYLYRYTEESVKNSNPDVKFKYGMDIEVYLEKAYENVKKDYRWLEKNMVGKRWKYVIKQIDGDWEFVRDYGKKEGHYVYDVDSADRFIKNVEDDYQNEALAANPVVAEYPVPFGHVEMHGWYLEKYTFYRLRTGDYKVYVQAGDRTTGGGREFFITPYCFEAGSYDEFLDRYLEIVPGGSFGLNKEDLFPDKKLREFLGY